MAQNRARNFDLPASLAVLAATGILALCCLCWLVAGVAFGRDVLGWTVVHGGLLAALLAVLSWRSRKTETGWQLQGQDSWAAAACMFAMLLCYFTLGDAPFGALGWTSDALLRQVDVVMFGGTDPLALLAPLSELYLIEGLALVYSAFLPWLYAGVIWSVYQPDAELRGRFAGGVCLTYAIGFIGYLFLPGNGPILLSTDLPPLPDGPLQQAVEWVVMVHADPYGVFPSLHVGLSVYMSCWIWRLWPRWRWAAWGMTALIALSCAMLRWHYVIDLVAGLVLALLVWRLVRPAQPVM